MNIPESKGCKHYKSIKRTDDDYNGIAQYKCNICEKEWIELTEEVKKKMEGRDVWRQKYLGLKHMHKQLSNNLNISSDFMGDTE